MRVLLVEDDQMIGASLKSGLGGQGMAVDWVQSAAEAADSLDASIYSVVLLDLGLPAEQSTWQGECFVFDQRVAVGAGAQAVRAGTLLRLPHAT